MRPLSPSSRRGLFRIWLVVLAVSMFLWCHPPADFRTRLGLAVFLVVILVSSLILAWPYRLLRLLVLVLYGAMALFLLFPVARPIDHAALRQDYVSSLRDYTGCPYFWGGEGRLGIDCSGLVRRGLEDTLVKQGFSTLNARLVREGVALWWHDTTAKVIGQGYGGRTEYVTNCPSLNDLDYALLLPGDLAVTTSGDHVLAYLGDKTWIAADPVAWRVTIFRIPETSNIYFSTKMNIVRWRILAGE